MAKYMDNVEHSSMFQALLATGLWSVEHITTVMRTYHVGATDEGWSVFPQIDANNQMRTARMQLYSLDAKPIGRQRWLHFDLKIQGILPDSFKLSQCPFGEDEVQRYPKLAVCIVPDEATALICKLFLSDYVWLAVGRWLRRDMLRCLHGRNVLLYPDSDLYEDWERTAKQIRGCKSLTLVKWCANSDERRSIADSMIEDDSWRSHTRPVLTA